MINRHTTKEGHEMLVAEMGDDHLLNTVSMYIRRATQAKSRMNDTSQSEYARHLYGASQATPAEVALEVGAIMRRLTPYIAELYMRQIGEEFRQPLAELLERETVPQLTSGNDGIPF
jgi:hypothetical protein